MPRSADSLFRSLAVAVLVALPIALVAACGVETGVTPSCVPNVSDGGIQINVNNGCTGFATCAADPETAMACCKSEDGGALSKNELAFCLFGYGKGPAPSTSGPTTGTGTSTGTGTATSSSSGSGGAGGGN